MLQLDRHVSLPDEELVIDCLGAKSDWRRSHPTLTSTDLLFLPAAMQSERARLQTFSTWPPSGARKLARYGFHVSREGDCIRCAFCGLEICGFSSCQEVKLWHWQVSGQDCPLLLQEQIQAGDSAGAREVTAAAAPEQCMERVGCVNTNQRTEYLQLLKSSSSPEDYTESRYRHHHQHHHHHHHHGQRRNHDLLFSPASSHCAVVTPLSPDSRQTSQELMPRCLAASLASREVLEPAGREPGCRENRVDSARPVTSSFTPSRSAQSSSTTTTSTTTQTSPSSPPTSDCGVMTWKDIVRTAQVPDMVAYQARLQSFSAWPLSSPAPREMARAGLFRDPSVSSSSSSSSSPSSSSPSSSSSSSSTPSSSKRLEDPSPSARTHQLCYQPKGSDSSRAAASGRSSGDCGQGLQDSARCFWCGASFHRWRPSDDPALEHARLSPGCRYVRQLLGHQLHQDVVRGSAALSVLS